MGTSALIIPFDAEEKREICTIYVHFDGYPEGRPLTIFKYLSRKRMVNGINPSVPGAWTSVINGAYDLAAHIITLLKNNLTKEHKRFFDPSIPDGEIVAGTIYVYPPGTRDIGEDYRYYIYASEHGIHVKAIRIDMDYETKELIEETIFEGTPEEYVEKFGK